MARKVGRLAGLVLSGWIMAALTLFLLPAAPGAARSERDENHLLPSASAPPITATAFSSPPVEPQTLVIHYQGQSAPPALLRALSDLQAAGQVLAIDPFSVPGQLFVLGDPSAIESLAVLKGVMDITPVQLSTNLSSG